MMEDPDAYRAFEAAADAYILAREAGNPNLIEETERALDCAVIRLYAAHGSPFGPSDEMALLWFHLETWTTTS